MPLFSNKFAPKKSSPRKADISLLSRESDREKLLEELGVNVGPIKIKLGDQESSFENGEWFPVSGAASGTHRENHRLKKHVKKLEEENNLLKLKLEVLLDMLTQTTAEFHLQGKELERLKPPGASHKR